MNVKGKTLELPLAVLKAVGRKVGLNLFLACEIAPRTGLGSSATVCVNLFKALAIYLPYPLRNMTLPSGRSRSPEICSESLSASKTNTRLPSAE